MSERNVFSEGALCLLQTSSWTARRKFPKGVVKDVNPEYASAWKRLIDGTALKPIEDVRGAARDELRRLSLPFPIDAVYFVPKVLTTEAEAMLCVKEREFWTAFGEFEPVYPMLMKGAREALGEEWYDESEYPKEIRRKFGFSWRWFSFSAPERAQLFDPIVYEKARLDYQKGIAEFREVAMSHLREEFVTRCRRLADGLSDGGRLYSTSLEKFQDYLARFEALDVTRDGDLKALVERCRGMVEGRTKEDFKSNEGAAKEAAEALSRAAESAQALLSEPVKRLVRRREA